MRTRYTLFILGLALLLIASCNREDISITYFKQLQSTSDKTTKEDSLMMPCGFIEYDSVRFSVYKCAWCDGWHIYNSNEGIETLNHEVTILDEGIISGEQKGFLYSLMIGMVTCFTLYS